MTETARPDPAGARRATGATETALLSVPASLRYTRLVRLTTAAVGRQVGFDVDDIEDLRIAVDELVSVLVEAGAGVGGSSLDLRFELGSDQVTVRGRAVVANEPQLDELTRTILAAVVEGLALGTSVDGSAGLVGEFTFTKLLPVVGHDP